MTDRATAWSVTINNPTKSDEENIALARQKGWRVEGQLERGEQGTQHYQLLVKTPQVRFSAVKKSFPRAHIEVARNIAALEQYVHKEETREGGLQQESNLYPSLQKVWDMFTEWIQMRRLHTNYIDANEEEKLYMFDTFIGRCIEQGYIVELIAVNPQIRSAIKKYGEKIYFRSLRRQTDRQTDENNTSQSVITNASEETVSQEETLP